MIINLKYTLREPAQGARSRENTYSRPRAGLLSVNYLGGGNKKAKWITLGGDYIGAAYKNNDTPAT